MKGEGNQLSQCLPSRDRPASGSSTSLVLICLPRSRGFVWVALPDSSTLSLCCLKQTAEAGRRPPARALAGFRLCVVSVFAEEASVVQGCRLLCHL